MTRLVDVIRIMHHDWKTKRGFFRIIRMSAWRWYRLGWDGMLEWLDKEIGKLPADTNELMIDTYTYRRWIKRVEPHLFSKVCLQNDLLFSIILVCDKEPKEIVAIESILTQIYPKWELLFVASKEVFFHDPRIKWIDAKQSSKAECFNRGLGIAKGDWILFLDADIRLSPYLLNELLVILSHDTSVEIIYTDDDHEDTNEQRYDPDFKSDFNPDMLYSMDYIRNSFAVSNHLIRQLGGFNPTFLVNPTYDFWLRTLEAGVNIVHIPKVLFHYTHIQSQDECLSDELKALEMHGLRTGKDWKISVDNVCRTHRIQWNLPKQLPKVTILIPTRDGIELLRRCVQSIIEKTSYPAYEILIIDNQSTCPDTLQYLNHLSLQPGFEIIQYNQPFNYSAINNFAVDKAQCDIIVLLNNDIEIISQNWLTEMVSYANRSDIGCVGAMLYYPDDTIQHAGVITGLGDIAGHAHKYLRRGAKGYKKRACIVQNYSAVTAACLAVRKNIYLEVGGMDPENLPVAYNDVDFCLKVHERGYRHVWTPYTELYHYESKSRGKDDTSEKKLRAKKEVEWMDHKWGGVLSKDPYYHPMLTKIAEQFQLRRS